MEALNLKEGLIIGVQRGEEWIDAKCMADPLQTGDEVVIYGRLNRLKVELSTRDK